MIRNYFKVALRNLWKNKGFSAINIIGLALGIACSLLILLWVRDEKSIDAFHANKNRLFYVYERNYLGSSLDTWIWTQGPLAEQMKKEIPEIIKATPFSWTRTNTFSVGEKILKVDGYSADTDFFSMFSYPLIEGNAANALSSPNSIAISKKIAAEFFGEGNQAVGKVIRYENKKDFIVSAVFELPENVSEKFNYLMSWSGYLEENQWAKEWGSVDPKTCILLRKDADVDLVQKKLVHFLDRFNTELKARSRIELGLQPFHERYLHADFKNGFPADGRVEYVRLFSIVAIFLLLIACINFMNLTTARSVHRAKEIGVRKVMGAARFVLIKQFLGEALLMAVLAAFCALIIVGLVLPSFNHLTDKSIQLPFNQLSFWLSIGIVILLTGIFSGSYPAFFLSSFNPIRVLKGSIQSGMSVSWFRKGLVVFQFVLSIVLIISTILISRQISFVKNAKLGYDRENLIYIPVEGELTKDITLFNNEAHRLPGIASVSEFTEEPTEMNNGNLGIGWSGKDPNQNTRFISNAVGPDFMQTMQIKMAYGRDFSKQLLTDSNGVIINQTALALTGYKDPIGKIMTWGNSKLPIVGVVNDFHFRSLHDAIQPLILRLGDKNDFSTILVRTEPGKTKQVLSGLNDLFKKLNPRFPFTYKFSDQEYTRLYKSEEITGSLSVIFAGLAIFISCLGLLGLSIFTAEQRRKEIGIRKILGASVSSLFGLLSKEFIMLIVIAFLIAAPLGWWSMHEWLQNYAYHTPIPLWIFAIAGFFAIAIALITVCFQALRAASVNPVKSLRTE